MEQGSFRACPWCGGPVSRIATFCGSCGQAVGPPSPLDPLPALPPPRAAYPPPPAPNPPAPSWSPPASWPPAGSFPQSPTGTRQSARPTPVRRTPRPSGRRLAIVAVLAVALAGAGIATGIVLSGGGAGRTESPRATLGPATIVASRDLQPATDPVVVSWGDQVQVTVPGGLLDRPRTLTIGTQGTLPTPPPAFSMLGAYDISLGGLHELAQPVQIRLAIDPAQLDQGVPASEQLAFFRFDEERSIWEDVPATIDDTALTATLSVTHLSTYGQARIDLQHFQQLATQPIYLHDNPAPHFRVIFDPNLDATFEDPTAIQVQGPQPPKKKAGSNDILRYAYWVGIAAEQAWAAYDGAQLDPPGKTDRVITDIVIENHGGALLETAFSWGTGVIQVPTAYRAWPGLKLAMGHELFHALQYSKLALVMFVNRWFIESTAEYAAGRIASTPTSGSGRLMGADINAQFLEFSVRSVLEANADDEGRARNPERQHAYASSHFLDFMINAYPTGFNKNPDARGRFKNLWDAYIVAARRDGQAVSAPVVLDGWLGGGLTDAYKAFAGYFLFNTDSPMPVAPREPRERVPDLLLPGTALLLRDADKEQSSEPQEIRPHYAARLWKILWNATGAASTRTMSVGATQALPAGVDLLVFVMPVDAPRQAMGFNPASATGPKPRCALFTSQYQCSLSISKTDAIYVLAVNSGISSQRVAVKAASGESKDWELADVAVEQSAAQSNDYANWSVEGDGRGGITSVSESTVASAEDGTPFTARMAFTWEIPDRLASGADMDISGAVKLASSNLKYANNACGDTYNATAEDGSIKVEMENGNSVPVSVAEARIGCDKATGSMTKVKPLTGRFTVPAKVDPDAFLKVRFVLFQQSHMVTVVYTYK